MKVNQSHGMGMMGDVLYRSERRIEGRRIGSNGTVSQSIHPIDEKNLRNGLSIEKTWFRIHRVGNFRAKRALERRSRLLLTVFKTRIGFSVRQASIRRYRSQGRGRKTTSVTKSGLSTVSIGTVSRNRTGLARTFGIEEKTTFRNE